MEPHPDPLPFRENSDRSANADEAKFRMRSDVQVEWIVSPVVSFALQQHRIPAIKQLRLQYTGEVPLPAVELHLSANPPFAETIRLEVGDLFPGEERTWNELPFPLDPAYLAALRESLIGRVELEVRAGGASLHSLKQEIQLVSADTWPGLRSLPELLAAFVLPNVRAVESLLADAAERLRGKQRELRLDGYQSKNRQAVAAQVGALFEAIQARGVHYANPPASFERSGQKVRLPQRLLESGLGTCLDTTLLFCACAEQAGLHPLIVMLQGHAFAAVWLEETSFPVSAQDSHSRLRNRVDLHEILPVETTLLCDPKSPFSAAVEEARRQLGDEYRFHCVIDVHRCRKVGVKPLPLLDDGQVDEAAMEQRRLRALAEQEQSHGVLVEEGLDLSHLHTHVANEHGADRLDRWKRNLLDLSLFNRLLNFRSSQKTLSLLPHSLAKLEDALVRGRAFQIEASELRASSEQGRPQLIVLNESSHPWARERFEQNALIAPHDENTLTRRLTAIYRAARLSIEENGSNTLYLALGFLRWRREEGSHRSHVAPLLLVPLTLERRSVREGYRIRRSDEEISFNTTLLELLKVEYGLLIPGLDPLPEDESGVDVSRVIRLVRHAIADFPGWTVEEAAELGLFSFSKFLMWRDLENHAEDLRASPLVEHLMRNDGSAPTFAQPEAMDRPEEIDAKRHPAEIYTPLSADSTQLAAVFAAAEGHCFVLEGPPGTGKSQTIANLIAHALGQGKTVLFVAEKRAALEVVHRRLSQIGLGDFLLELHSNKSSKVDVLKQLAAALNAKAELDAEAWTALANELAQRRDELNQYVEELHQRRPAGMSLWEGLNRLIPLSSRREIPLSLEAPCQVQEAQLEHWKRVLTEASTALQWIGDPMCHALADCRFESSSRSREQAADKALQHFGEALLGLHHCLETAPHPCRQPPATLGAAQAWSLLELLECLSAGPWAVPASLWEEGAPARALQLAAVARERNEAAACGEAHWHERADAMDYAQWALRVREVEASHALAAFFGKRALRRELRGRLKAGRQLSWEGIKEAVEAARRFREAEEAFTAVAGEGERLYGPLWRGGSDAAGLQALAEWASSWEQRLQAFLAIGEEREGTPWKSLATLAPESEDRRALAAFAPQLRKALEAVDEAQETLVETLALTHRYWDRAQGLGLGELQEKLIAMRSALPGMREWRLWLEARQKIEQDPLLASWLPEALAADPSGQELGEAFEQAFLYRWVDAHIDAIPCLANFFRQRHEGLIEEFRQLDQRYRELTKQVLRARLAARIPPIQTSTLSREADGEMSLLLRELQKKQRHLPVRRLLEQIPRLLRRLKPCLLMSPLSVAQYLQASGEPFDIVVFDEASQITPWDALGALARGRSAVVVGDPKQLPPTAFFQRSNEGEMPEEQSDLESILDECLAARLPCKQLGWHYRSRHESLITFSNHRYYGNGLLTFPSIRQRMAVQHLHVADGQYDKGGSRTNRREAECVVAEVVRRLTAPQGRRQSLGVVTFSSAQQQLIEELLDRERAARPELERWFSEEVEEPVFVKNLENVQGDERDVILFSIAYGPDAQGRVSMNFGPLNQEGGQRRLNVAITRAREEILVVSTLLPEQIDLTRSAAPGVGDLRQFLEFARRGPSALANLERRLGQADPGSPLEAELAKALRERGYEVHTQVGCSGYRIDLAVVHPDDPEVYILGVECDGPSYHSARNARDREMLRHAVLSGLGWNLMRCWSTEWWRAPQRELDRIVDRIDQLRQSGPTGQAAAVESAPPETRGEPAREEETPPEPDPGEPVNSDLPWTLPWPLPMTGAGPSDRAYRAHRFSWPARSPERFHEPEESAVIQAAIAEVIAAEAPISESLLCARVRAQWGLKSSGKRILERVRSLAQSGGFRTVVHGSDTYYWPVEADPAQWKDFRVAGDSPLDQRSIEEIPPEEIAAAAHAILASQISLSRDGLIAETARRLGFRRAGRKVVERVGAGVDLLISRGVAEQEGASPASS